MKTITLLFTTLLSSASFGQTEWIETTFWRAPRETNFNITLSAEENLIDDCAHYKKLMLTSEGEPTWMTKYPEKMTRFRELKDPAKFVINDAMLEKEISEVDKGINKLPFYSRSSSVTGVILKEAPLSLNEKAQGYAFLIRSLGLPEATGFIERDSNGEYVVKVSTLDLACDVLEGRTIFETRTGSYVYLKEKDSLPLYEFYNEKLISAIRSIFNKKETPQQRAVRLGYRIGKILETETREEEGTVETQLQELIRLLFKPQTLEPGPAIVEVNKKMMIHIESKADAPAVKVTLGTRL